MEMSATLSTLDRNRTREVVHRLLEEARSREMTDRRAEVRHPFFAPVHIMLNDGSMNQVSAFSREISPLGIGLLHSVPLAPGAVTIKMQGPNGSRLAIRTEIMWCQPCGEGWYLSGGHFLQLLEP